jgi:spore germination protein GerM
MSIHVRTALVALCAVIFSSCGPGAQDGASPLGGVPGELTAPTTTSTTTTSTSVAPTETTVVETETVVLHFVLGESITTVVRNLPRNPDPQDVLDSLLDGYPTSTFGPDVRSAIPRNFEATVTVERGIATVDVSGTLLTEISPIDQPLAIAQIVLTLTSRPGVGQVEFRVDGEPQAVPRGGGELARADEAVAYDDYAMLVSPGVIRDDGP